MAGGGGECGWWIEINRALELFFYLFSFCLFVMFQYQIYVELIDSNLFDCIKPSLIDVDFKF